MAAASGPEGRCRGWWAELLRRGEKVPGFGHFVVPRRRPARPSSLLDLVRPGRAESPASSRWPTPCFAEVRHKSLPEPNIDFANRHPGPGWAGMVPRAAGRGDIRWWPGRRAGIAHAPGRPTPGQGPLRPRAGLHRQGPRADGPLTPLLAGGGPSICSRSRSAWPRVPRRTPRSCAGRSSAATSTSPLLVKVSSSDAFAAAAFGVLDLPRSAWA